jgi:hypothetical protein
MRSECGLILSRIDARYNKILNGINRTEELEAYHAAVQPGVRSSQAILRSTVITLERLQLQEQE